MNFLGNGLQLAAFIVLTAAFIAGLMITAAAVVFLLYKSRSLGFRNSDHHRQISKRAAAAELMKEGTRR